MPFFSRVMNVLIWKLPCHSALINYVLNNRNHINGLTSVTWLPSIFIVHMRQCWG
jgi:hypothetical protein